MLPTISRLFSRTAYIDYLADKTDILYGRLVYRRVFLFRFVLENLRCATTESQQLLVDISSSFPTKVTVGAIARFLQVPGIDTGSLNVRRSLSATVKRESRLAKLDIVPLHTVPLFRPSRSSAVAGCQGSTDPPSASQRMSQFDSEDGDNNDEEDTSQNHVAPSVNFDMEQMRLRAFSTPDLSSSWFFLDCFAPTALHAAHVSRFLLGAMPVPAPEAQPFRWDSRAMQDMVIFFWDALHSLSSRVKHYYTDPSICGHKLTRKVKKVVYRVSRALLFQCISYWIVEFLQTYGFNPKALMPFSSIEANLFGDSAYEIIKTLRLLSLSFRMKSKVPKLFGSRFHAMVSEKVKPVLDELFNLCTEMVALHDSEEPLQDANPLISTAHNRLSVGVCPISNPFPSIYLAIVEFLPLAVDRVRRDVREIPKGYPVSWPDHTPPSSKRKNKDPPSQSEGPDEEFADAESCTNQPPNATGMGNTFVLDEAGIADTSSFDDDVGRPETYSAAPVPPARLMDTHVGQSVEERPHTPTSPPSASKNKHVTHSTDECTNTKRFICGDCKDSLYTFFSDGLEQGFTPGAIGLELWSKLRLRQEKKCHPASHSDEASSSDEERHTLGSCQEKSCSDESDSDLDTDVIRRPPASRRCLVLHSSDDGEEESRSEAAYDEEEDSKLQAASSLPVVSKGTVSIPCSGLPPKRAKIRHVSFSKDHHDSDGDEMQEE